MIVGDPLQLEPITTIPFEAEQAIRAHYGVGEEWLTGRSSVQSLAGRLYPTLPQSKWIDVRSETSHGHWIPAEGDEVDRILAHLGKIGFDSSQAMAIAPFRDVARPLSERTRAHPGLRAGTIHTAQGKEADVVILVLGSDPASEGARMWAAERPSLLNVAVSRAKRRLYVVGDREAWMRQRYFDALADRLPHDHSRL